MDRRGAAMDVIDLLEGVQFWHWWVLAVALIAIEVFAPTTLFLWMGISAAAVGAIVLGTDALGWESQILLFAVLSVVSVIVWRFVAKLRGPESAETSTLNRRAEQYVGQTYVLREAIVNGRGKINVDDTTWKIEGADLEEGARVKVVGVDGVVLKVQEA